MLNKTNIKIVEFDEAKKTAKPFTFLHQNGKMIAVRIKFL